MVNGLWLSHEPITFMPKECPYLNIHGHLHSLIYGTEDRTWKGGNRYFNVSVERINYTPISFTGLLKNGLLKDVKSIHRIIIDRATNKKRGKKTVE